jgi:chromosome segregation ATPase
MKTILVLSILLCAIALPALAELTDADLDKIRLIVKEDIKAELAPIKSDIVTLKTDVARLEGRITGLEGRLNGIEKQISHATNVTYGLMVSLIVVAIGIPAWRGKRDSDQERRIEALTREIETLKQIVNP